MKTIHVNIAAFDSSYVFKPSSRNILSIDTTIKDVYNINNVDIQYVIGEIYKDGSFGKIDTNPYRINTKYRTDGNDDESYDVSGIMDMSNNSYYLRSLVYDETTKDDRALNNGKLRIYYFGLLSGPRNDFFDILIKDDDKYTLIKRIMCNSYIDKPSLRFDIEFNAKFIDENIFIFLITNNNKSKNKLYKQYFKTKEEIYTECIIINTSNKKVNSFIFNGTADDEITYIKDHKEIIGKLLIHENNTMKIVNKIKIY